jgi:hypothetical protein
MEKSKTKTINNKREKKKKERRVLDLFGQFPILFYINIVPIIK